MQRLTNATRGGRHFASQVDRYDQGSAESQMPMRRVLLMRVSFDQPEKEAGAAKGELGHIKRTLRMEYKKSRQYFR
eukprot:2325696-Pyramimonas_sp.AAC.1